MMRETAVLDLRNPIEIRKAGLEALNKELGVVGTAYFLRQFNKGNGDYTAKRDQILDGITLDEAIESIRKIDASKT